ncbi:hypothetical protein [Novosphingobium sp. TCA1]|uniref:Rad50/SbcC-type AAA domain-containing protein n=1 Tax=Novosphingobium pentaromativorans TaxID=205844 RepID=A0A2W5NH90_9SPHN|nr:hypothetical protein [Novosphingobium sp. TCA1]PZQ51818.1 MAG: hypothetical protein DI555_20665 [Novosphingobium pentaromativorans]GFE76893.1 hypothetical protein NTCA1_45420 [Novosphingobium sp. TCA1]
MIRISTIKLSGAGQSDAVVRFGAGANILGGQSDTGKSLLVACLDYVLGAEKMAKKRVPKLALYSHVSVEFRNLDGKFLTMRRHIGGGTSIEYWHQPIDAIGARGPTVEARRRGRSTADDVASILFPFAGVSHARLRKNARGELARLSARTLIPALLVDEVSMISEISPILGKSGYDETVSKRMFAYLLSGRDDDGIVATERPELTAARLNARLELVEQMLIPLDARFKDGADEATTKAIEQLDRTIADAAEEFSVLEGEVESLLQQRQTASNLVLNASNQLSAIGGLSTRYNLLRERYTSDLQRLDFVSEGAHFFGALQEVVCPICDQVMALDHEHGSYRLSEDIQTATRAEAAKIRVQQDELAATMINLEDRRAQQSQRHKNATDALQSVDERLREELNPQVKNKASALEELFRMRLELEGRRGDHDNWQDLRALKARLEADVRANKPANREWETLPLLALAEFCSEVEKVLLSWKWASSVRVTFDESDFDIVVNGQPRQSHGKGVRGLLYSAFTIALLRYCRMYKRPHPGFVIIDSPLTAYQKSTADGGRGVPVDSEIERAFWESLKDVSKETQIIVIENKLPPEGVTQTVHFEWFYGDQATDGLRQGFLPQ